MDNKRIVSVGKASAKSEKTSTHIPSKIQADTLFTFTTELDHIVAYIKNKMVPPRYCEEDIRYLKIPHLKKIAYPMLADPTHVLSRDFEVYIEADGVAERGTFIVNPEGKIVAYEVTAGNVGRNADEIFRRVQASQFVAEHGDEVCPAKWQPGAETLKPSLDLVGLL